VKSSPLGRSRQITNSSSQDSSASNELEIEKGSYNNGTFTLSQSIRPVNHRRHSPDPAAVRPLAAHPAERVGPGDW
jgi:hypothetical protein